MSPTANLFSLAQAGAKYLRQLPNGLYVIKPSKAQSTHTLKATYSHPRRLGPSDTPKGRIRLTYADPKNFVEFNDDPQGRAAADAWLLARQTMAKSATPLSVVTIPRGRAYKNFAQRRAEAARDGSLYDKPNKKATMASKNTKPASAGKNTKNDITRPKDGTTSAKIWGIADAKNGERSEVLAACAKAKINEATAMTQFGRWRAFHGLVGRTKPAAKKPAPPAKKKPAPPKRAPKPAPAPAPAPEAAEAT
jgi:hypothetical protein